MSEEGGEKEKEKTEKENEEILQEEVLPWSQVSYLFFFHVY